MFEYHLSLTKNKKKNKTQKTTQNKQKTPPKTLNIWPLFSPLVLNNTEVMADMSLHS